MKMNIAALVGLIFLDLILVGFAIGLVAIVFSAWVVVASFIASSLLVVISSALHLQGFELWRLILSALLAAVGITAILPFAKFVTKKVHALFISYLVFHQQMLYRRF